MKSYSWDLFELLLAFDSNEQTERSAATRTSGLILASVQSNSNLYIFGFVFLYVFFWHYVALHAIILCLGIAMWVVVDSAMNSLEDDVVWIERESRLLRAIVEDARAITALSDQVKEKALRVWGSDSGLGSCTMMLGLTESETEWVNRAEDLVNVTERFFRAYGKKMGDEISRGRDPWFSLIDLKKLLQETEHLKKGINRMITGKDSVHICESLETSWSVLRKLVERPIEQHESSCVKHKLEHSARASISRSLWLVTRLTSEIRAVEEKVPSFDAHFIKLQVELIYTFLKQIEGVKLESEVGDAWVAEIEGNLNAAWVAIQDFLEIPGDPFWWFFITEILNSWQLRKEMNRVNARFSDLFKSKETHRFKLTRRDSSNANHRIVDDDSSSIVANIRSSVDQQSTELDEVYLKLTRLCSHLEDLLGMAKSYESRNVPTVTTLKKAIQVIADLATKSLKTFQDDSFQVGIKKARERLSQETDRIDNRIYLLMKSIDSYNIETRVESSSVIGLEEVIHRVVSRLTINDDENSSVVSIVGMEGVGKTTLAKKIYSHRTVVSHFGVRAWVTLPPQHPKDDSVLEVVARQIMGPQGEVEHLQEFWSHMVCRKKYLLVLDNVSTKKAWESLNEFFSPTRLNGSRILLTTSSEKVESVGGQIGGIPHKLRLRTKEESLRLFKQIVDVSEEEESSAKEIVDRCWGLPQAILHVGYLTLWSDMSTSEMLKHLKQKNDRKPLVETFKMTGKVLPLHLRDCLSYLRLFPLNFEIPARRVVALWVAEGFVSQSRDGNETPEDVAEDYLSQLIDHNIVQLVKRKPNGKVDTCCFPVAMHELWLIMVGQHGKSSASRLADHFDRNRPGFGLIHGNSSATPHKTRNYEDLHSFLSFDPREGDEPGRDIGKFLRRGIKEGCFLHLHVLDLERVFRPELPESLGRLKTLRYLGLRWTYLENIPSTVGNLTSLETLDVKHTDLRTLPVSVWRLQGLRHLYLNKSNRSKFTRDQSGTFLKNLETLWNVFVDERNPLKDRLDELTSLRKLGLSMQLESYEQRESLAVRIAKIESLRCLKLRSTDEMGGPHKLFLRLSGFENLSVLDLFGILENPSEIAVLPKNLTELTLSATLLLDDPMPVLEKLPSLKLLCIYSNSYTGKRMVCSSGGFPQLLVLRIWKLKELEDWEVDEDSLQNLRELEIRSCNRLKIPDGLNYLNALIDLKLY